jgi:hypothetical protein
MDQVIIEQSLIGKVKTCPKCLKEKDLSEFRKDSHKASGYGSHCKECCSEYRRHKYHLNPEKEKQKHSRWVDKNREHLKSYVRNRKDHNAAYARARRVNVEIRTEESIRRRINNVVSKGLKAASTLQLLGCTREFFVHWLESQWLPGMTWENYGINGWHIDHIRPCSSFSDLTDPEQQKECFHWSNMQPMWAYYNRVKQDKILPTIDYQI